VKSSSVERSINLAGAVFGIAGGVFVLYTPVKKLVTHGHFGSASGGLLYVRIGLAACGFILIGTGLVLQRTLREEFLRDPKGRRALAIGFASVVAAVTLTWT
jgi:hypothetical protein